MPAPIPGDPEYDAGGYEPLTEAAFEREIRRIRDRRALMLGELHHVELNRDRWDDAARTELHGDTD